MCLIFTIVVPTISHISCYTGYHQGDTVACCVMEARQDGVVVVSISPKLLEDLSKVKKKKRTSSTGSSGISKQRKLQLAEVKNLVECLTVEA